MYSFYKAKLIGVWLFVYFRKAQKRGNAEKPRKERSFFTRYRDVWLVCWKTMGKAVAYWRIAIIQFPYCSIIYKNKRIIALVCLKLGYRSIQQLPFQATSKNHKVDCAEYFSWSFSKAVQLDSTLANTVVETISQCSSAQPGLWTCASQPDPLSELSLSLPAIDSIHQDRPASFQCSQMEAADGNHLHRWAPRQNRHRSFDSSVWPFLCTEILFWPTFGRATTEAQIYLHQRNRLACEICQNLH